MAPELWTPAVYVGFEGAVGALVLCVGARRPQPVPVVLIVASAAAALLVALADAADGCAYAYALLACASGTAAVCMYECQPRDSVEEIARLGLASLLAFQAARGLLAFAACGAPVLMAMLSSAGSAVHVTAFALIAWAARR